MMPATNWATPRATAAASNPAAAPVSGPATVLAALRSVRPALLCVITVLLRSVADRGLVGRGADSAGGRQRLSLQCVVVMSPFVSAQQLTAVWTDPQPGVR